MGTKTLPTTRTVAPGTRLPRSIWQFCQVPLFLIGVLVLTGVCLSRAYWGLDDRSVAERNLDIARRLLFQPDCSPDQLAGLLSFWLTGDPIATDRAGEAHLLMGTAYLRCVNLDLPCLGECTSLCPEMAEPIARAREHLEKGQALGVPESDKAKLRYRLGKVWFLTREDPKKIVAALAGSVDEGAADNLAEGYTLLTHAYLRLPEPDLKAALEVNKKQMDVPRLPEEMLGPARLLRGELLLRSGDPAGAREVLQYVKQPASPALISQARYLQARTFHDEKEWAKASKLWFQLLTLRKPGTPEAGQVLYFLGACHRKMDEPVEALRAWEKAVETAPPQEAVAAALGLAELRLLDANPQTALDAFRRAVKDVATAAEWKNPFWDLTATRELFERGCLIFHATGRYELAMKLAEVYEKLAPAGATLNLIAQSAEAAAKAKLEQAQQTQPRHAARVLEETARALFQLAAKKHESAAEALPAAEQPERLWQAAECHLYGQDYANAVRLLDRLARMGPPADRAAQVWYLLAEARRALHQEDAALAAYIESAGHRGPYAYRSRYQLAVVDLNRGQVDKAQDQLERNLYDLSNDPDPEAQKKCLFELAGLLFRKKAYQLAAQRLEEAVRHFQGSSEAILGRYQLGECYRNLAQQEIDNLRREEKIDTKIKSHHTEKHRELLALAAAAHEDLLRLLNARLTAAGSLSEDESGLFWRGTLAAAECRTDLGDYQGPIVTYETLITRFPGRVETLYALAGIARCHFMQQQGDRGREVLDKMKKAIDAMDDAAFPIAPGMMTRAQWQQWVKERLPR